MNNIIIDINNNKIEILSFDNNYNIINQYINYNFNTITKQEFKPLKKILFNANFIYFWDSNNNKKLLTKKFGLSWSGFKWVDINKTIYHKNIELNKAYNHLCYYKHNEPCKQILSIIEVLNLDNDNSLILFNKRFKQKSFHQPKKNSKKIKYKNNKWKNVSRQKQQYLFHDDINVITKYLNENKFQNIKNFNTSKDELNKFLHQYNFDIKEFNCTINDYNLSFGTGSIPKKLPNNTYFISIDENAIYYKK